jgi:hypothetical protein
MSPCVEEEEIGRRKVYVTNTIKLFKTGTTR